MRGCEVAALVRCDRRWAEGVAVGMGHWLEDVWSAAMPHTIVVVGVDVGLRRVTLASSGNTRLGNCGGGNWDAGREDNAQARTALGLGTLSPAI